jgi:hypothetical protein
LHLSCLFGTHFSDEAYNLVDRNFLRLCRVNLIKEGLELSLLAVVWHKQQLVESLGELQKGHQRVVI